MDCIELFKKAAAAMQTDPRLLALTTAQKACDEDQALQELIGQFNLLRIDLNEASGTTRRSLSSMRRWARCIRRSWRPPPWWPTTRPKPPWKV